MKLWLLLIYLGEVVATWGPLPYGRPECLERAADIIGEIELGMARHPKETVRGRVPEPGDFGAVCVDREDRIPLGTKWISGG